MVPDDPDYRGDELDDDEAADVIDGFEWMDEDENDAVDWDEWYGAIMWAIE